MTTATATPDTVKSEGHLAFAVSDYDGSTYEFYQMGGHIYRAPIHNAIDVTTGARIGRWDCIMNTNNWDYTKRVWNIQ